MALLKTCSNLHCVYSIPMFFSQIHRILAKKIEILPQNRVRV